SCRRPAPRHRPLRERQSRPPAARLREPPPELAGVVRLGRPPAVPAGSPPRPHTPPRLSGSEPDPCSNHRILRRNWRRCSWYPVQVSPRSTRFCIAPKTRDLLFDRRKFTCPSRGRGLAPAVSIKPRATDQPMTCRFCGRQPPRMRFFVLRG